MKIAGLDYGEKTIGVSISDILEITANPVTVIRRTEKAAIKPAIAEIKRLIERLEIEEFVLGHPKRLDNSISEWTEETERFGKRLEKETGLKVTLWDERLSTVSAERMLISADMRRDKRKQKIDAVAATMILQNYLDYKINNRSKINEKKSRKEDEKNNLKLIWRMKKVDENYNEMIDGEEAEEFDVIVLTDDETGEDIELVIIDSAEADNCTYLLVIASEDFDEEEPTASIIKETKAENDEFVYEVVENEEEFNSAAEYFKDSDDFDIV